MVIGIVILGVHRVYAQAATPPATPDLSTLTFFLSYAAKILRTLAYSLAVAVIIYAGILYLTAYGDENKPTQAKNLIKGVAIGLMFVVLANVIVLALLRGVSPKDQAKNGWDAIKSILQ